MARVAFSRGARFFFLWFACSTALALSPRLAVRQYRHTAWTEFAGQPLPAVESIAQADDGYLWMITSAGAMRFDGVRFSEWRPPHGQRLPRDRTRRVASSSDGAVWMETQAGLSRLHRGRLTHYPFDWSRSVVNTIFDDPSGSIWIAVETATDSYVLALPTRGGAVRRYGPVDGLPPRVHVMQRDGAAFWLGVDGGVCRWIPGAAALCYSIPGVVASLAPDGPGAVYAATSSAIYRLSHSRVTAVVPTLPNANFLGRRLLLDRDGNLWAGTTGGLLRVSAGNVETFTRKDGLSGEFIHDLLEDAEGDLWVATNNGLDRFRNPRVLHVTTLDGLSAEVTTAVKAARDGSIWVGTYGNGLNRIAGAHVTHYSVPQGLPGKSISAIEEDRDGRLWVATGPDVAYFDRGRFVKIESPVARQQVYALAADSAGVVWAAANALWRIANSVAEPVAAADTGDIFRVLPARNGAIWLGSFAKGLRTLDPSLTSLSDPAPGIGPAGARQICEDSAGSVWIASGGTLNRIRGGKVTTWGAPQGLAAGDIYGVTLDRSGNAWMTAVGGVVRVPLADLERSPDGEPGPARFTRYDEADGVRPPARGGMASPRITTAADGRVWFCERDGVGILDPDLLRGNPVPPPVAIEQLTADGVALDAAEPRFRGRQLRITYTAACTRDAVCNETGAAVDFRVMALYYQTIWFRLGLAAAVGGAIWGGFRLRVRRVVARYRLVAQERARVTREIHDSLLQGFAGVVLQLDAASRQFTSNPSLSKERLDRALEQADESLREARLMLLDMRLPILEGRTLAEALAEVGEGATRGTPISFHLKTRGTEKALPYPAQAALFLIGREAIYNAVNHARPSRITLNLTSTEKEYRLHVQDDGCGFDLEALKRKAGHLGVQGMAERARDAGAQFHIDTAPSGGTRVNVVVPRKRSSM
jgi:signal transduction histidine kinase/ligand-binding sensor domain-containing protein